MAPLLAVIACLLGGRDKIDDLCGDSRRRTGKVRKGMHASKQALTTGKSRKIRKSVEDEDDQEEEAEEAKQEDEEEGP